MALASVSSSRLTVIDWAGVAPEKMAAAYSREVERWAMRLGWDTTAGWLEIERGRVLGTVQGWVAMGDDGRIAGWCYYLSHRGTLQIGGFIADSDVVAQALLARIPTPTPETPGVTFFAFADAPGLPPALRARGLTVERFWYLTRDLQRGVPSTMASARSWGDGDVVGGAELLRRSYAAVDPARPFCPAGTIEEWTEYVQQLTCGIGCGVLLPECSLVVPSGPGRLAAMAIVTRLSEETAHLAQLAVDPVFRRRGLAQQLVESCASLAGRRGYDRFTLLVGGRNAVARGFYESIGFTATASFLAAGK